MVKFIIGLAAGWLIGVIHMCLADLVDRIDDLELAREAEELVEEEQEPDIEEETNLYDDWYEMDWGWEDV